MPPTTAQSLNGSLTSLKKQWQALQPGQRRTLGIVGLAAVAGLLLWAGLTARGPAMVPLYTNLTPQDGAAILTQLQHSHTPYRLSNGGQTILVPQAQVDALRLELAGQGLPNQGNVGLSSVLNLPFGATDFTRQVAYQDALQGELAQTIEAVQGVKSARVQIVLPQSQTFGGGGTPASAAVLVDMQPGTALGPAQVQGIMRIVAGSVQGLTASGVTVINQTGQVLSANASSTAGGAGALGAVASQAESNLRVQRQFDQQLGGALQTMLDQVFGPGNVVAQVQAQLSFDSGTVNRTIFLPPGTHAVVASMSQLKKSVKGQAAPVAVPGTATNSLPPTYKAAASGTSSSTSSQLSQNFDVSQEQDHTIVAPGTLTRLSVSVVVNSRLTPAQRQLVQAAVKAAVGYDGARRDLISVVGLPFNQSLLGTLQKLPINTLALPLWRQPRVLIAAIGVLLVLLVLALLRRRVPAEPSPAGVGQPLLAVDGALPPSEGTDALVEAVMAARRARSRAEDAVRDRPEDVARVIRAWLTEDE